MKNISCFLFLIFLFSCREKDENLDLKYEVLNQLIKEDSQKKSDLIYLYKTSSATNFNILNLDKEKIDEFTIIPNVLELKSDSIFSSQDIEYLISQTVPYDSKVFDLDKEKIIGKYDIIKESDLFELKSNYNGAKDYWIKFNDKFGKKCLRNYSEPIFNLRKDVCIVKISESCGPLWGGGYTGIFKKLNGIWVQIGTQDHWIS